MAGTLTSSAASETDRARVQEIVALRCVPCHATKPAQPGFDAPPNGLIFERVDQVMAHLPEVQQQLALHAMPLGNVTRMTEGERATVLKWIGRGAPR
jgi:uncharacterized membrane protein